MYKQTITTLPCTCVHRRHMTWKRISANLAFRYTGHYKYIVKFCVRRSHKKFNQVQVVSPCFLLRIQDLSRLNIAIPRGAEGQAWYCDAKCRKNLYQRKQTESNEFIPCSNNVCHILKRFCSFQIPATSFISPKALSKC